jgi:energy-coupling factor transporter ATP-binding protein EcfA2
MSQAILAEGLVKRFGQTMALDGVDLALDTGTVLGVLGPNGAGKTTAVRILATLLRPDAGHARSLVGLTGQYASVDESLTGAENLRLIGRLLSTGCSRNGYRMVRASRSATERACSVSACARNSVSRVRCGAAKSRSATSARAGPRQGPPAPGPKMSTLSLARLSL